MQSQKRKRKKMIKSEIITIGTEILIGQILDTNSKYLAQRLLDIGIGVRYKTSVGDRLEDIVSAIKIAIERADLVITTGGLGPTIDDLTREAIAKSAGVELEFREELFGQIKDVFDKIGYKMTENNKRQAFIPEGSIPILNRIGTAPGFIKEIEGVPVICLPGVPRELRYMMENEVIPWIKNRFSLGRQIIHLKVLKVVGTGESKVDRLIADVVKEEKEAEIGILASESEIKIRISAKDENIVKDITNRIRKRLGKKIYGEDNEVFEEVICNLLEERNLTLSILETFSGGKAAQRLIMCPAFLKTEIISKKNLLEDIIGRKIESVNREISIELAERIRNKSRAKIGLSIVGFPLRKGTDFLVKACAGVSGEGIEDSYVWTMGGKIEFIQERGAVIGLNTLRLSLINHE